MTFLIRQCYRCSGKGFRYVKDWFDPTDVVPETCDLCNGTGKLPPETTEGDGIAFLTSASFISTLAWFNFS